MWRRCCECISLHLVCPFSHTIFQSYAMRDVALLLMHRWRLVSHFAMCSSFLFFCAWMRFRLIVESAQTSVQECRSSCGTRPVFLSSFSSLMCTGTSPTRIVCCFFSVYDVPRVVCVAYGARSLFFLFFEFWCILVPVLYGYFVAFFCLQRFTCVVCLVKFQLIAPWHVAWRSIVILSLFRVLVHTGTVIVLVD